MRIAKLTLDGYNNYGNVLQNYALQKVLESYANTVDTLWHGNDNFMPKTWGRWSWKEFIKYIIDYQRFRTKMKNGFFGYEMVRQAKIKAWADHYIHIRKDCVDLKNVNSQYDFFVVGSDQVWNPKAVGLREHFLSFASYDKRIAYAASIASPIIPKEQISFYKEGLEGMKWISMREQEGADTIKKLIGSEVPVLVDPTMLLEADEWSKVSRCPSWYHGRKYILTYFLGKKPQSTIQKISQESGIPIINMLDEKIYEHYITGVDEFLWAIKHASLVYTDSFHGTVFSILFKRPFVVCDRMGNNAENKMSSRIDTLLQYFGLENRRGTQINGYQIENPFKIVYGDTETIFQRERFRADEYLRKALGLV